MVASLTLITAVLGLAPPAGYGTGGSTARADTAEGASGAGQDEALRFGIFPGGAVGSVNPVMEPRPERSARRIRAIQRLRSGHPFVAHLYRTYWGGGASEADDRGLDGEIGDYTEAGIDVEVVARFRPTEKDPTKAITGYQEYVRALVARYGGNPGFVGLQVTNEANLSGAADASDGSHGSAIEALVQGVQAASDEVRTRGASQVRVGFNWAWEAKVKSRYEFWQKLGQAGGPGFSEDVDWVGMNAYPDTWTPLNGRTGKRHRRAGKTLVSHLRTLREELMPRAGIGSDIPLHVTENGWPTGQGRSNSAQEKFLKSMIRAVSEAGRSLNISDYRWFDLRDSNSSDSNFESHYGLMTDDYAPKPAFFAFRDEIARENGEKLRGANAVGKCFRQVRVRLGGNRSSPGWRFRKFRMASAGLPIRFARINGKRAARLRGRRVGRNLVLTRIPGGEARIRIRLSKKRHGRVRIKTVRRRAAVCGTPG